MKTIIDNFKKMTLFQKVQVLSGIVPLYSALFVVITTYIVNWKAKKGGWVLYGLISAVYCCVLYLAWNPNWHFVLKYIITFPLSIIGNYLLVSLIQIKNK